MGRTLAARSRLNNFFSRVIYRKAPVILTGAFLFCFLIIIPHRHAELVSAPHRSAVYLACGLASGVLKQVQHDRIFYFMQNAMA
jgi:hypothetical protein